MPNLKNAKKALRQDKKRTEKNLKVKKTYKETIKKVKKAVESGQDTKELLVLAQKSLGKAAKAGVIKKQTASRKISRLMKMNNKKSSEKK